MKLLICTQAVDENHAILGFFIGWIQEFAKHFDEVHVICLIKGEYTLPDNVYVHSLGKEEGENRLKYLVRFYRYIWNFRHEYDVVFVHMNQEYILLAGILWKLMKKKTIMWRNHYSGSFLTHIAAFLANDICYTSQHSYTSRFSNSHEMPTGIDTDIFKQDVTKRLENLLYVGRISDSKRIHTLLEAFRIIHKDFPEIILSIAGGPVTKEDHKYELRLKEYVISNKLPVIFLGPQNWHTLPHLYSAHKVCINLSPPGMFDKVIGEALSCGCLIVTTNLDVASAPGVIIIDGNDFSPEIIALAIKKSLVLNVDSTLSREFALQNHSLKETVKKILDLF